MSETREDDRPLQAAPVESAAGTVTIESDGSSSAVAFLEAPPAPEAEPSSAPEVVDHGVLVDAPAAVDENAAAVTAANHGVLVDAPAGAAADESAPARAPGLEREPVTHENPAEVSPAPVESSEGSMLSEEPPPAPITPARPAERGAPVLPLPQRPRLRVACHYQEDQLHMELTLMTERRELVHRVVLQPLPGGPLARIFEALVAVVANEAMSAGVFGAIKKPD